MNKKITKVKRLLLLTKIFVENPSKVFTLQYFSRILDCAKSTLSEDIDVIENLFEENALGKIISIPGAAGGIYYSPTYLDEQIFNVVEELCESLKDSNRIITGGYLYMNDIFYNPEKLRKIAKCIATRFIAEQVDYVVTIETKGIPLAMALADLLNKPVVVVRKSARLTEGPTIQVNYLAGSSNRIKTMALPIKSIERGTKVLFVDDFMKAGGTAKGIVDLMKEFDVTVVGIAVVMASKEPEQKLIDNYYSLIEFEGIDESNKVINVYPSLNSPST